ncbi:hypothetical protein DXG01_007807 [Tephrocybe rancida]|nr:hypothetical protein DXG01_007807 [Tephrocybe rancida]
MIKAFTRLPTPLAGPRHLVTASQVVSSEFARLRLSLPVPKALAWRADSNKTDMGAKFIIEEDLPGLEPSHEEWDVLSLDNELDVTRKLWKIEKKTLGNPFARALKSLQNFPYERPAEIHSGRRNVQCSRSTEALPDLLTYPGTDPYEYLSSLEITKDIGYTSTHKPEVSQLVPPSQHTRLKVLTQFDQAIPYVVPVETQLILSTFSHPTGTDTRISESVLAEGRIEITAITGWQHAIVVPMYFTTGLPAASIIIIQKA